MSRCWGPNKDWSENVFEHFAEMMQLPGGFVPGQKKIYAPTSPGAMGPLKSGTSVLPLVGITSTSFYALQCGQVTNTPLSLDTPVSPCPLASLLAPLTSQTAAGSESSSGCFGTARVYHHLGRWDPAKKLRVFLANSVVQPAFATSKHPFAEVVPFRLLAWKCNVTEWNVGFAKTQRCKCSETQLKSWDVFLHFNPLSCAHR